ncbi:unnamed protein product [Thelazia callipaeda]|uniref:PH domain-containing protein n=1 Tax=Thelazia callipaeda TaxID=103827 RepID=A0A0N5CQJ6_THECL|nr:unnamed protein product [Thelazia callipaeda]
MRACMRRDQLNQPQCQSVILALHRNRFRSDLRKAEKGRKWLMTDRRVTDASSRFIRFCRIVGVIINQKQARLTVVDKQSRKLLYEKRKHNINKGMKEESWADVNFTWFPLVMVITGGA